MAPDDVDTVWLEAALRDAGRALEGASRDLSADVTAALRTETPARRSARRRLVPAVVVAVLLTGAAVASTVVPGIDVRFGPWPSRDPETPLVADRGFLGAPVTLDAARERVDFAVGVPTDPRLPAPQIHLADRPSGARVSLLYPAGDGLPAMGDTPVGAFLTQFRGRVDESLLTKVVEDAGAVTPVEIGDLRGWWIEGAHDVLYVDGDGDVRSEPTRFAGSVLLWARDGVTLRLESALDRRRAIAIAASVR